MGAKLGFEAIAGCSKGCWMKLITHTDSPDLGTQAIRRNCEGPKSGQRSIKFVAFRFLRRDPLHPPSTRSHFSEVYIRGIVWYLQ